MVIRTALIATCVGILALMGCRSVDAGSLTLATQSGDVKSWSTLFSQQNIADFTTAANTMKQLAGMSGEDEVSKIITSMSDPQLTTLTGSLLTKYAINVLQMHKYGNQISEFSMLAQTSFSYTDPDFIKKNQAGFDSSSQIVELTRTQINSFVSSMHPGFAGLNAALLLANQHGNGVVVAVFDVFDKDILARQQQHYQKARIKDLQTFGDPVGMDHGNSVIDVILTLAPNVTIVPVTADSANYNNALKSIADRSDIDLVNMSRTLLGAKDGTLDGTFAGIMDKLVQTKIITKAMGNTGTDLDGVLTPLRVSLGLGPVGNMFAYDAGLIKSWLQRAADEKLAFDLMLLAVNLDPFGEQIAQSATTPGKNQLAQQHALGTPSDGVFSFATDNFESGSSFGAPILAGLSALLLEKVRSKWPQTPDQRAKQAIVASLQGSAIAGALDATSVGCGMPQGDSALAALTAKLAHETHP